MKRFSIMVLTFVILLFASTALANNAVTVFVNEQAVACDVQPTIENGRIYLPVRAIFEELGANVIWNKTTQTITATKDNTIIKITIGNNKAYKNNQIVKLDEPAKIIKDRTFVPLGFINETLGTNVGWDGKNQSIIVIVKK